jgi:hypothetical protein
MGLVYFDIKLFTICIMFTNFGKREGFHSNPANSGSGIGVDWKQMGNIPPNKSIIDVRHENLKSVKKIFEIHDIRYCLIYGTMLGQYRGKNFIPGDEDDDVWIDNKDKGKFNDKLLRDFEKEGFYHTRSSLSAGLVSIGKNGRYIDFCFNQQSDTKHPLLKNYYNICFHWYDKTFFKGKFNMGILNNEEYPILHYPNQFLKNWYGNDFMTPSNSEAGNICVGIDGKSPSLKSIPKIVKRKKKKFARNGMKRLLYGF